MKKAQNDTGEAPEKEGKTSLTLSHMLLSSELPRIKVRLSYFRKDPSSTSNLVILC